MNLPTLLLNILCALIRDNTVIIILHSCISFFAHLRVKDSDTIKQPVGYNEEQHQHSEQRPEHEDPREACPRWPEEEGPDGQQQYEQLEGNRDEEALTGCAAALQLLWPEEVGEHQECEWRQEHQQAQDHSQCQGEVPAAVEPHTVLQVLGDPNNVLLRQAVL